MSLFDQIVAKGNRTLDRKRFNEVNFDSKIKCADGFELSVIAGDGTYCSPRPSSFDILATVPADYPGPYYAVEVGYPSQRPEPWHCTARAGGHDEHGVCDGWESYAENEENPTETVYGYVPVDMVRALVASHGGEA